MGSASEGFGYNESDQISEDRLLEYQAPYIADLYKNASSAAGQNTVAGFDPLQTQGQNLGVSTAGALSPYITNQLQNQNFLASGGASNPNANPYLRGAANAAIRPIYENLNQNTIPSIRGEAAGTGNVGSSRQGIAEGLATQGAQRTAGDITSNIYSNAFGQGLGAQTQALGMAPQMAQLSLLPANILSAIGGERQGLEQRRLDNPLDNLSILAQILGDPTILNKSSGEAFGTTRNSSGSFMS